MTRRFAKARKDEQAARRLLVECEDLRASIAEVEAEIEACIKEQHTILAQRPALPGPQRNVALCEEYETDFAELILLMLLSVGHEGMQGRRRGRERASVSAGSPFALLGERVARAPRDRIYHGSGFAQSSSSLPPPHALDGRTSVSAGSSQMFLNDRLPLVALSQLFAVLEEFILFNDRDDDLGRELKQGKSNIEVLAYLLEAGVLTWLLEMLSWFAEGGGRGFEKEDELICAIQVAVRLVNSMVGVSRTSKPITAVMQDQFSGRGVVGVVVDALSRCLVWAAESEQLNATEREDALQSISNLTEMLGEMLRFAVGWADVVEGEKQEERGEVEMEGDLVVANGEERNGERKLALDERGKRDTERDRHRHYRQQQDKLAGDVRTLKTTATAAAKVLLGWISVLLPHVLAWQEGDVYDLDAEESNSQLCKIFRCLGLSLIECTGGETLFEDFRFHKLLANCAAILAGPSLDDQLKTFARDFSRIASHVIFVSDRRLVEMHLLRLHAVRSGLHESIVHGIPMRRCCLVEQSPLSVLFSAASVCHKILSFLCTAPLCLQNLNAPVPHTADTASVYPCLERLRIEYEVWTGRTEALVKESQKGISIAIAEARAAQEEEERRRKRWERRRERRMRRKIEKRVNEVKAKAEREAKRRPKRSKFDRRVLPPVNMLEERRKDGEGKLVEPEKRFQVRKLVAQSRSTEAILRGVDLDEVRDKRRKKARDANKGVRKRIQRSRSSGGGLPGI